MPNIDITRADPTRLPELKAALAACPDAQVLEPIKMDDIRIGGHVLEQLPEVIRGHAAGRRVLLVQGSTPMRRGDADLKAQVNAMLAREFDLRRIVLDSSRGLHADDTHSAVIEAAIRQGTDCVVALGGGTMADLCKHAVHETDLSLPLVIVQTALSVNAFSDGVAVMIKQGVKRTVPAKYPNALLIDSDVIRSAPQDMNAAGYGDLCATWTAPADWLLAHTLEMNPKYHPAPGLLLTDQCRELLGRSADLRRRDPEALMLLARVLTLSGLSMGIAGESTPCSGSEHLISHLIDMSADARGQQLCYHGAQVSIGSILCCIAWHRFLTEFDPAKVDLDRCYPDAGAMRGMVLEGFRWLDGTGAAAEECWKDYEKKLAAWKAARGAFERFLAHWDEFRAQASALVIPPEELCARMAQAGAPKRFSQLTPSVDRKTARWAALDSCLMRNRFVLTDLLFFLGWWNGDFVDDLFARADALDAGY